MIRKNTEVEGAALRFLIWSAVLRSTFVGLVLFSGVLLASPYSTEQNWKSQNQDWTNYVRIGAYG